MIKTELKKLKHIMIKKLERKQMSFITIQISIVYMKQMAKLIILM